jgi:hypothetical protein
LVCDPNAHTRSMMKPTNGMPLTIIMRM